LIIKIFNFYCEEKMSILNVENISHGFGARKLLENASFRLLKGEHVGLIGANGEGKSTFLNIITGKLMPDEGKVEWCSRVTAGYMDQYTVLKKGDTIRKVLREAFQYMFDLEQEMLQMYEKMSECSEVEVTAMLEDVGEIQSLLERHQTQLALEREQLRRELRQEMSDIAVMAASKALRSQLTPNIQSAVIDQVISELDQSSNTPLM
jgi:ATPase subunit of ABC transporter with duplicated ATPase domains